MAAKIQIHASVLPLLPLVHMQPLNFVLSLLFLHFPCSSKHPTDNDYPCMHISALEPFSEKLSLAYMFAICTSWSCYASKSHCFDHLDDSGTQTHCIILQSWEVAVCESPPDSSLGIVADKELSFLKLHLSLLGHKLDKLENCFRSLR